VCSSSVSTKSTPRAQRLHRRRNAWRTERNALQSLTGVVDHQHIRLDELQMERTAGAGQPDDITLAALAALAARRSRGAASDHLICQC
jgi:hypothetical protein